MNTLRKQTRIAIPIVLVLSILIGSGIAYANPPTSKTLRTNIHWTQANNNNGVLVSAFSPQSFNVNLGDSVELIISSRDQVASDEPHLASAHPIRLTAPNGDVIDEVHLHPGETESIAFVADQLGEYIFRCANRNCEAHRYMISFFGTNGVITVTA